MAILLNIVRDNESEAVADDADDNEHSDNHSIDDECVKSRALFERYIRRCRSNHWTFCVLSRTVKRQPIFILINWREIGLGGSEFGSEILLIKERITAD